MSEHDPIRVKPGELTIPSMFPSPAQPAQQQPPAPSPEQVAQQEDARRRDEELTRWHQEQERTQPGRFEIIDQRDAPGRQEQWRRENASGGVAGDAWRGVKIGADKIPRAVREVVRAVPIFGRRIVDGVDAIDRWSTGRDSETLFSQREEYLRASQTPEQQAASRKQWVEEKQNPDGTMSYSMGAAWSDPRSYLGAMAESLPGTVVTMVPAAALARGAYAAQIARGAGERAAAAAAARTAMIAGGVGEGVLAGGETSAEVREAIGKLPEATLQQSEAYRQLIESGMTPERARAALADDRATKGMLIAGVATGVFGGMGDRALAKIVAEGVQGGLSRRIASGAARGAVAEGVFEELPQSIAEQMAKNFAVQGADPNQRIMEGVPNAAAGGLVVGGLMGGGMGAGGGAMSRADAAATPEAALPAPASAAEARGREVGAGTAAPSGPLSAAVDYATRQSGGAPTTAPSGAPAIGADVRVRMPRGQSMTGVIEGYSIDGEPMVRAEVVDPETGEVRIETLQVPLSELAPAGLPPEASPVSEQAAAKEPRRDPQRLVVARRMPDGSIRYGRPGEIHAHLLDEQDDAREFPWSQDEMGFAAPGGPFLSRAEALKIARANEPARVDYAHGPSGLQAEQYQRGDAAVPPPERPRGNRRATPAEPDAGRIPPDEMSALPPRAETVPLIERPYNIRQGGRVIVDDEATVGRFGATLQAIDADAGTALVRGDNGRELEMPMDRLRVSKLSQDQVRAQEAKANPPEPRETITKSVPTAREVAGKQIVLPDGEHAALFDLGRLRRDSKATLGRGALDLDTDRPMAEQVRLAGHFGVSPQRLAQIADDYRYRVERAAKQAASRTPVQMHRVNDKLLGRMKAEDVREAKKGGDQVVGNQTETQTALALEGGDQLVGDQPSTDAAAAEAATSPTNERPEPSQAQKKAGNYKLGHLRIGGFDISIENPAGSTRSGTDRGGKAWSITMKSHYGYFRGTKGRDKDHIDVFLKAGTEQLADAAPAFVVDQVAPDTRRFDEHKVMLGFQTLDQARRAYLANYARGWKGLGTITPTTVGDLKAWFAAADTTKPFARAESVSVVSAPRVVESAPPARRAPPRTKTAPKIDKSVDPAGSAPAGVSGNAAKINAPPADVAPDFAGNKLFTADRVEAARARLREKMKQVNSGIDPEVLMDGLTIAGAYIESGVRSFADYARRMVSDLGPNVRPYLLSFWEAARHYPGLDARDMTSPEESARLHAEVLNAPAEPPADQVETKESDGGPTEPLDRAGEGALAGPPADAVRSAEIGGNAGPDVEGGRRGDVPRDKPARAERVQAGRGVPDGAREPSVPAGGIGDIEGDGRGSRVQRPAEDVRRGDELATAGGTGRERRDRQRNAGAVEAQPSGGLEAAGRPISYTITDGDELGAGGAKRKFRNNVAAIRLIRTLTDEARTATRDEQSVLAKWVGWGGLRPAFARDDGSVAKGWEKESAELKELLTAEEYRAAESSTRNAHYTAPEVVRAMWQAVERLGFKGGQVLEPSVGAGNFLGLAPGPVRAGARFTGVELDHITGAIAKNLYLDANIQAPVGFQDFAVPDGHFDLAIGNPPFGSEKLFDRLNRDISKFSIHNYFFAKSVDGLKPGGVLAMVITSRFLDGADASARGYIADRAELLGAIRLPNTAFQKNAGTEVTTDIVFLRRLKEGDPAADHSWTETKPFRDPEGRAVPLNSYFHANPDMMLGQFGAYGTMYARDETESALIARAGDDLPALLNAAVEKLPAGIMDPPGSTAVEVVTLPLNVRGALEGSMFLDPDGAVWERQGDVLGEPRAQKVGFANETAAARVAHMVRVRDTFARLRQAQLDPAAADKKVDTLRERLNKVYDAFTSKHGPINADANKRLFRDDPTWPQISALEDAFDKGVSAAIAKRTGEAARAPTARKAPIFTRRTQQPYARPTSASSAKDALSAVLSDLGRVDLAEMSRLYGRPEEDIVRELGTLICKTPAGAWETSDIYLSGNVKQKLAEARRAAAADPDFRRNVAALEDVQPADIEAVDIDVKAGAPWVPAEHVAAFGDRLGDTTGGKAVYSKANAKWVLSPGRTTAAAQTQWGTERVSLERVVEAAVNGDRITVQDKMSDGSYVVNHSATDAANEKVERVRAEWRRWIWEDDARRDQLARIYNDTFNTNVETRYDGSHLALPGKVGDDIIALRPHQKNAVWRAVQSGIVLFDHTVGAGKTFAAIASVMELRRTGRASKPMLVVPNHLVGQWAADFVKLYPGARVLAPTERDFEKERRQRLFARISTGDWDAVIIAHSSFKKLAVSPEYEARFIETQVADLEASIQELRRETGEKSRNVAALSKQRDNLRTKMQKLLEGGDKDRGLTWEDLGIDFLGVDEAHEFKNLAYSSSMQRVAGLGNQTGSQKASDLYIKTQHVLEKTGGRGLLFATGTPLSNSMAEMYTVMRYLDGAALNAMGLAHFDAWARVFGEVVSDWELSPTGQYKLNQRFARFVNVPELMQRYRSFADVVANDDIKAMLAAEGKRFPLPKVKGGKPTNLVVERSKDQALYIGEGKELEGGAIEFPSGSLIWRAENLPKKPEKGGDNMLKIMSDARKAALDMRLIDASYRDITGSKVHRAADEMIRIYRQSHRDRGTQLVFIDLSTPQKQKAKEAERIRGLIAAAEQGDDAAQETLDNMTPDELSALDGTFSVYDDLKAKLVDRGVPANEIAFIHDANTDLQKQELFGKVRSGRVRFLFGSTPKMGAGTNVQNRLVGLHHLDAPWRPSDLEQRDGRGIRQGNELYEADPDGFEIEILRYATKNTLDARQWQTIEAKARFIEQLRKGNVKTRTIEDIAGEAANAAEMKAAASGNPLILEEMSLRQKVRRLEGAATEHDREQYRIRSRMRDMQNEREKIAAGLASADAEKARAEATIAEFTAKVSGEAMEKPKDMGAAVIAAGRRMLVDEEDARTIGSYGRYTLSLSHVAGEGFDLELKGEQAHEVHIKDITEADASGLAQRMANTVRRLADAPAQMRERDAYIKSQLPKLEAQIGPFEDAAQLADAQTRHAEVLAELRPKPKPPAAPATAEGKASLPDEPVATITGGELGMKFRGRDDMPALRKAAQRWYDENLIGTVAVMPDGTEVRFNKRGMRESTHGAKGDILLRAVPAIRSIIESGTVVLREPGKSQNVRERVVIAAPVSFMGRKIGLALSIHQTADGRFHYDFTMDRQQITGPGVDGPGGLTTKSRRSAEESARDLHATDTDGAADKRSLAETRSDFNLFVWNDAPPDAGGLRSSLVSGPAGALVRRLLDGGRVQIADAAPAGAPAGVQGWTAPDGTITLVAPSINEGQGQAVLLHELFHAGVRPLIGSNAWSALLERLDRLHRQFDRSTGAAKTFFDRARVRVARSGTTGELAAEEFGAYAIEEYEAAPRAVRGWIDDVVGRVKAWLLVRFGSQVGRVTPAQLRALAAAALRSPAAVAGPGAVRHSIGAAVADAGESAAGMLSLGKIRDTLSGLATDIQPALLATVPLNYFSELKRPGMTSVDAYLSTKRDMDTYRANRHEKMVTLAEDWRKFAATNRTAAGELSALMHEATLASFDPARSQPDKASPQQVDLATRWKSLPAAAHDLYRSVRDSYVEQQAELDKIILENVDKAHAIAERKIDQTYRSGLDKVKRDTSLTEAEKRERIEKLDANREADRLRGLWGHRARMTRLRQKFESSRLPAPYFPLSRFGRYFVTIKDPEGHVVSFSRFEREAERRRWVRENWSKIQRDVRGASKEEGVIDNAGDMGRAMDSRIIGEIDALLSGAGVDPGVMDAVWQRYLATMPDMSIRKRYIHRKGTSGFQTDALKGFASHMFHAAHQMARLRYGSDLGEALSYAADEAKRSDDPTRGGTLINEMRKRHEWVMNPTGSRAAQAVTSAMFVWYLAATPAAAIVNMTQPIMLGVPILGTRLGGQAKAAAALTRAARETVAGSGSIQNSANLTKQEKDAVAAFYESGLIERSQTHDLAGIGDTGVEYSPLRHRVMSVISWGFHRAEVWNREVTALAAYRMAREAGQGHREAVDTAHDLTWKVNFDYSNSNRARILQNDAAKLIGVFQNFQINMWYRLFRDLHQSFKGDTPQARIEARHQLAGIMGMMGLLGGITGIAGYNVAMAIAGMFFGKDDDPFEFKHQVERSILELFGPQIGGMMLKGVPGKITGLDLTSRIGMPDFFLRAPDGNKDGRAWWQQLLFNAMGVVPSTIVNTMDGAKMIAEGKQWRGVEMIVPKAVRDIMKAWRFADEGVQNRRGDEVVSRDRLSGWNLISQAIGFTPAQVAEAYERNSRIREAQQQVQKERRELLNQFALAFRINDPTTRAAVLERIKVWNARPYARGFQITGDTLRQSLQTRQQNAVKREDGVLISNATLNRTLREGLGPRINP